MKKTVLKNGSTISVVKKTMEGIKSPPMVFSDMVLDEFSFEAKPCPDCDEFVILGAKHKKGCRYE